MIYKLIFCVQPTSLAAKPYRPTTIDTSFTFRFEDILLLYREDASANQATVCLHLQRLLLSRDRPRPSLRPVPLPPHLLPLPYPLHLPRPRRRLLLLVHGRPGHRDRLPGPHNRLLLPRRLHDHLQRHLPHLLARHGHNRNPPRNHHPTAPPPRNRPPAALPAQEVPPFHHLQPRRLRHHHGHHPPVHPLPPHQARPRPH